MKRIISILLILVFAALLLTACASDPLYNKDEATADEAATEAEITVDINEYNKDFDGLQKYLIDCGLIWDDDKHETVELYSEILGADKGIRYMLNTNTYIEFYAYGSEKNDMAQKVFEQIKDKGTFEIAGLDPLTGVISDSGNFLAVYDAKLKYDYDKILEEFKKF